MNTINYLKSVPNSHSFGSLNNILAIKRYTPNDLNREYLIIGFKNTLEREYEIVQNGEPVNAQPIFPSIENIIKFLEKPEFNIEVFLEIIENTLKNNIDLKCRRKMERIEVYKRLDTERDYQDLRWTPRRKANGTPDHEKPIAEWVNYMEFHIAKAKEKIYYLDDNAALAEIRKVMALGVRCMELHGCPERIIPDNLSNQ